MTIFHKKKSESFDENRQNGQCFQNLDNFAPQDFVTYKQLYFGPKNFDKGLSFHMKYFNLHLNEKSEKTNFISPPKKPQKHDVCGCYKGAEEDFLLVE